MTRWKTVSTINPRVAVLWRLAIAIVVPLAGLVLLLAAMPGAASHQVAATAASAEGEAFLIVTGTGSQIEPALAYNSTDDQYLVIYQESDDILALRLQGDGRATGDSLIVTDTVQADQVDVAYHEQAGEYLVVWNQWPGENDWSVYGQRISAIGELLGEGIDVAVRPGRQRAPAVAAHGDEYLVVWDESRVGWPWSFHIYGLTVSTEGHVVSEAVRMSAEPGFHQVSPDLAFNTQHQESLLVFRDARYSGRGSGANDDIFGQRIGSAGDPVLEYDLPISLQYSEPPGGNAQNLPTVAYDRWRDRYLVVWEDGRNDPDVLTEPHPIDIYGQILSGEGMTVTTPVSINLAICVAEGLQKLPDVAYSDRAREYLVVWEDHRGADADIYARRVSGEGFMLGDEIVVTDAPGDQRVAVVVYGQATGQYLIVWQDDRDLQTSGTDLYGRFYRPPDRVYLPIVTQNATYP